MTMTDKKATNIAAIFNANFIPSDAPLPKASRKLPSSETFTLSEAMRGQTAGRATWNTSFKEWTEVPKSMLKTAVEDIRKRKGLAPEPPGVNEFIDKE